MSTTFLDSKSANTYINAYLLNRIGAVAYSSVKRTKLQSKAMGGKSSKSQHRRQETIEEKPVEREDAEQSIQYCAVVQDIK